MKPLHVALGVLLAGVLGAALVPLPEDTKPLVGARRDSWSPLALPLRLDATAAMGTILGASYWGPAAQVAQAAAPPPEFSRWRISAVYRAGQDAGVWVEFGEAGKPPQRLRLGDALPSGHRIVEIGERDVCVIVGKKKLRVGVERWNG